MLSVVACGSQEERPVSSVQSISPSIQLTGDLEKLSLSLDAALNNPPPPAQCLFSAAFWFPWVTHCLSVVTVISWSCTLNNNMDTQSCALKSAWAVRSVRSSLSESETPMRTTFCHSHLPPEQSHRPFGPSTFRCARLQASIVKP